MSLVTETSNLLIKQYWEKPKAKAEIELIASMWDKVRAFLAALDPAFDLDSAVGSQLDVLGRIEQLGRSAPGVIARRFFGFSNNTESLGFADKFDPTRVGGPFADRFSSSYTDLQLPDIDYRAFIGVKAAFNRASAYLASDELVSIQDVILLAFDGQAYVTDNLDMTLTLHVPITYDPDRLRLIQVLGLLPKPQGVRYIIETIV